MSLFFSKFGYRLRHRGPDWSGLYQNGDNYLAHQRLAVIDPASGDQPLFNEDKTIVVTVTLYPWSHIITLLIFLKLIFFFFLLLIVWKGEWRDL